MGLTHPTGAQLLGCVSLGMVYYEMTLIDGARGGFKPLHICQPSGWKPGRGTPGRAGGESRRRYGGGVRRLCWPVPRLVGSVDYKTFTSPSACGVSPAICAGFAN